VDEGVPFRLAGELRKQGIDIADFAEEWRGLQNGKLLERIREAGFECLLTCDKNLRHQQNLGRWDLAIIVLPKVRFDDLFPLLDRIAAAHGRCERGRALVIGTDRPDELY
jgi:hypothetical protein